MGTQSDGHKTIGTEASRNGVITPAVRLDEPNLTTSPTEAVPDCNGFCTEHAAKT